MELDHLFEGNGEQSIGEGITQRRFIRERETTNVIERADIARLDAPRIHLLAIPGNLVVDHRHLALKLRQLKSADLLTAHGLDLRLVHSSSLFFSGDVVVGPMGVSEDRSDQAVRCRLRSKGIPPMRRLQP